MARAFTERTAWARNLAAPVRDYLNTESSGALALLAAAVAALAWSNSPWSDSYESFWTTDVSMMVGDHGISLQLREWISEGLMTLFFLVVGLEARREFDTGVFRERRRIALPVLGAIGGMAAAVLDLPRDQRRRRRRSRLGGRDVHGHRLRPRRAVARGSGEPRACACGS